MNGDLMIAAALVAASSLAVYADIPAPKDSQPSDWTFVLTGVTFAFLAVMLFVWLGRKFFKRPQ